MDVMRSIPVMRAGMQRAIARVNPGRGVVLSRLSIAGIDSGGSRVLLSWLLGLVAVCGAVAWNPETVAAQSYQIFMPSVSSGVVPTGLSEPPAQCDLNEQEAAIAQMMESDPGQKRDNPVCDPILAEVARGRARDMALRGYFSHVNPDGDGPNLLVRDAGFQLPDWYQKEQDANNVESIAGGYQTPAATWQGWLTSPIHRRHVLGTDEFYASQNSYGVGYYASPDSPFKYYWVFISAPTPGQ